MFLACLQGLLLDLCKTSHACYAGSLKVNASAAELSCGHCGLLTAPARFYVALIRDPTQPRR